MCKTVHKTKEHCKDKWKKTKLMKRYIMIMDREIQMSILPN